MRISARTTLVYTAVAGLTIAAAAQSVAHAPDGGIIERIQSITIPPLTNAPFSATVATEWTKIMPDGSTATMKNRRTVARDSTGKIFQERRYFSPAGDTQPTRISNLQYSDPERHEFYNCIPVEKTCYVSRYYRNAMSTIPVATPAATRPGKTSPSVETVALGQKTIEDLDVIGSREVVTIQAGVIGNQKPEPIVKEFWYSPHLGINVVVKRFDPRSGIENFAMQSISRTEPDTRIFQPPADYKVVQAVEPGLR